MYTDNGNVVHWVNWKFIRSPRAAGFTGGMILELGLGLLHIHQEQTLHGPSSCRIAFPYWCSQLILELRRQVVRWEREMSRRSRRLPFFAGIDPGRLLGTGSRFKNHSHISGKLQSNLPKKEGLIFFSQPPNLTKNLNLTQIFYVPRLYINFIFLINSNITLF